MATVAQYRRDVDELIRLALADLDVLWRQVSDAIVARELLAEVLPELTAVYGSAAGTLAADWFDELREEQQVPGRFRAIVADLPDIGRTEALAGWAIRPLLEPEPDWVVARALANGGLQRIVADVGRGTIIDSSLTDGRSQGWRRVTSPNACGFCKMLADRGRVYSSRTVNFGAHDHCSCSVAPSWNDDDIRLVEGYAPSTRNISDADRARARQWMRDNGY